MAGISTSKEKCCFRVLQVSFLAIDVSANGMRPGISTMSVVKYTDPLTDVAAL